MSDTIQNEGNSAASLADANPSFPKKVFDESSSSKRSHQKNPTLEDSPGPGEEAAP
jgi:hypothetical protein